MKRWFRSLRLHILLPAFIMVLLLVILMTVVVSRSCIAMSLRQESDKNTAFVRKRAGYSPWRRRFIR